MPQWIAERLWPEATVVVVAGGPSLSLGQVRTIGMARTREIIRVVAINDAVYPCWFADLLYFCDRQWGEAHDGVPGFRGRRVTLRHQQNPVHDDADWLLSTGPEGFEPDPGGLRTAGNSGYQAINLAAHLGARHILLVGYDMRGDNSAHWFGLHPESCRRQMTRGFDRMAPHFNGLAEPLRERGIAVVNCTPGSAITAFPTGDLMTELKRAETVKKPAKDTKTAPYADRQIAAGGNGYKTR